MTEIDVAPERGSPATEATRRGEPGSRPGVARPFPPVANGRASGNEDSVEAGCKAVIGQRLKLSGMRWSVRGATGIVTLRCQEAGGRSGEIRKLSQTQTSVA